MLDSNLIILFSNLGLFLAFQAIIFQLELPPPTGYAFDILLAGLYLIPVTFTLFVTAIVVSVAISRVGTKPFMILGSLLGAVGFLLLSTASSSAQILYFEPVMASGLGCLFVSSQKLLVLSVEPRKMGLATSMNTVFRSMGSSLGSPIAGTLITTFTSWVLLGYYHGTPIFFSEASDAAFRYAFYLAAASFLLVLFTVFFAREFLGRRAAVTGETREMAVAA